MSPHLPVRSCTAGRGRANLEQGHASKHGRSAAIHSAPFPACSLAAACVHSVAAPGKDPSLPSSLLALQDRGRVSRRQLLETQELPFLEASGQVVGQSFKNKEIRAHTNATYRQNK